MVFQSKGSNTRICESLHDIFRVISSRVAQSNLTSIIERVSLVLKHYSLLDEHDYKLCIGFNKIIRSCTTP